MVENGTKARGWGPGAGVARNRIQNLPKFAKIQKMETPPTSTPKSERGVE
jgi:hypothetical protein